MIPCLFSSALQRIRGSTYFALETELEEIVNARKQKGTSNNLSIILSRVFLQPFACVGVIYILFRFSGSVVLSHYTATFFELAETSFDPLSVSISIGVIRIISTFSVPILLKTMSKRMAFIVIGSASTMGMLSGKVLLYALNFCTTHSKNCSLQWPFMRI